MQFWKIKCNQDNEETEMAFFLFAFRLGGLHLKFSKATGLWTAKETGVYIGETMGLQGKQRAAIWVRFLHQEERLSRCVDRPFLSSSSFPPSPIPSSFTQLDFQPSC